MLTLAFVLIIIICCVICYSISPALFLTAIITGFAIGIIKALDIRPGKRDEQEKEKEIKEFDEMYKKQ